MLLWRIRCKPWQLIVSLYYFLFGVTFSLHFTYSVRNETRKEILGHKHSLLKRCWLCNNYNVYIRSSHRSRTHILISLTPELDCLMVWVNWSYWLSARCLCRVHVSGCEAQSRVAELFMSSPVTGWTHSQVNCVLTLYLSVFSCSFSWLGGRLKIYIM